MISPYITGGWVTGLQFYGRERLIETILHGPDANLWIIGNRRVGKTSLLREIERRTANSQRYIPLYWDMSASRNEAEFAEKLKDVIDETQHYSQDTRWADFTSLPTANLRQTLRHLTRWVQSQNLQLLLLCDETEGLLSLAENSPATLQDLRDALQNQLAIRPVLASTRRLSRLYEQTWDTSFFLDGFASHLLLNFRNETANQVIGQTQNATSLYAEEALLSSIRQATGNHPLLIQKLCSQLFDTEQGNLRPFLAADLNPDIQMAGFFQLDFNALTLEEAKLVQYIHRSPCALAELENQFSHSKLKSPLYNLVSLGFLRRVEDSYHIGNLFLTKWLETLSPHHIPQGGITKRLLREVAQERVTSLQRQLIARMRNLGELELQQAKMGLSTPPHIVTEIKDYKEAIADLEIELTELGENLNPFQTPQSE